MARIHRDVGDAFEAVAKTKMELMKAAGIIAYVEKQQPRFAWTGPQKGYVRAGASGADFHGVLTDAYYGLGFAIETKSVDLDSAEPYLELESRVTTVQRLHLDEVWAANQCAFIAAQFRSATRPWFTATIPWGICPWDKMRTRHRLYPEAAIGYTVPTQSNLFDHLLARRR